MSSRPLIWASPRCRAVRTRRRPSPSPGTPSSPPTRSGLARRAPATRRPGLAFNPPFLARLEAATGRTCQQHRPAWRWRRARSGRAARLPLTDGSHDQSIHGYAVPAATTARACPSWVMRRWRALVGRGLGRAMRVGPNAPAYRGKGLGSGDGARRSHLHQHDLPTLGRHRRPRTPPACGLPLRRLPAERCRSPHPSTGDSVIDTAHCPVTILVRLSMPPLSARRGVRGRVRHRPTSPAARRPGRPTRSL